MNRQTGRNIWIVPLTYWAQNFLLNLRISSTFFFTKLKTKSPSLLIKIKHKKTVMFKEQLITHLKLVQRAQRNEIRTESYGRKFTSLVSRNINNIIIAQIEVGDGKSATTITQSVSHRRWMDGGDLYVDRPVLLVCLSFPSLYFVVVTCDCKKQKHLKLFSSVSSCWFVQF